MVRVLRAKHLHAHARVLQHRAKSLRLRAHIRVPCHMQNQKRRQRLALRHVRHRRKIAVQRRIVPKFHAMPEFRQRLPVRPRPHFRHLDDRRNVERVSVDRHAALDRRQRQPVLF